MAFATSATNFRLDQLNSLHERVQAGFQSQETKLDAARTRVRSKEDQIARLQDELRGLAAREPRSEPQLEASANDLPVVLEAQKFRNCIAAT